MLEKNDRDSKHPTYSGNPGVGQSLYPLTFT